MTGWTRLTVKRKADRETLANEVIRIATECQAEANRAPADEWGKREVAVYIKAPGGLCVTVIFDGDAMLGDVHMLSWHMSFDSDNKLSSNSFKDINTTHYRKATDTAWDFGSLRVLLKRRLDAALDGTAYQQTGKPTPKI